jgi:hypothetical protein
LKNRKDVRRVVGYYGTVYEVFDAEGKHEITFDSVQEAFAYCVEHQAAVFFHP